MLADPAPTSGACLAEAPTPLRLDVVSCIQCFLPLFSLRKSGVAVRQGRLFARIEASPPPRTSLVARFFQDLQRLGRRHVVLFAALTALRRGELLRMTAARVVDGAILLDAHTKSGRPRAVPLSPQIARIAKHRLPWSTAPTVLPDQSEAARLPVDLPDARSHDLRHAFASWAVQGGASLAVVHHVLGHSSLAVTSKHSRLARPDLAKVASSLRV